MRGSRKGSRDMPVQTTGLRPPLSIQTVGQMPAAPDERTGTPVDGSLLGSSSSW
jgi:hypothetical protein